MDQQIRLERQIRQWLADALGISERNIELVPATGEREEERVSRFCDVVVPRTMTVADMAARLNELDLWPYRDRGVLHLFTHDVARLAGIDIYA